MKKRNQTESGQIIVIFAIALIALLALTALAIDGGMVYADRRHDQNVADAAAFAGGSAAAKVLEEGLAGMPATSYHGSFECPATNACGSIADPEQRHICLAMQAARAAAQARARENINLATQTELETGLANDNGVEVSCVDNDTSRSVMPDKYIQIEVRLTSQTKTSFAHIVTGENTITNKVAAIVRVRPRQPFMGGNAIVALKDTCSGKKDGVYFNTNKPVIVNYGGIFSNACIEGKNKTEVNAPDGKILFGISWNGVGDFNPEPEHTSGRMGKVPMPEIDCDALPVGKKDSKTGMHQPGTYTSLPKDAVLAPGLYCVKGGLKIPNGGIRGEGVTIYIPNGGIDINGGTNYLRAPTEQEASAGLQAGIAGLLIYLPESNDSGIKITGNPGSDFVGTIYAPSSAIRFSGNSNTDGYHTQFIGYIFEWDGTSSMTINYDQSMAYSSPAYLELFR
ncbi:MAG TPA: pilus assembly protein TadG-related protein [Anaerolineaceae bacterium]|jgi:Flp pilus assembly protein TadG|nr:pilus assembly protein TadG-related protein [Anaerolineaceae bacterium]